MKKIHNQERIKGKKAEKSARKVAVSALKKRLKAVLSSMLLATKRSSENKELIHELRVQTRRAVATLELYSEFLPKKRAQWMKKQLKQIRESTNAVRNGDVIRELLSGKESIVDQFQQSQQGRAILGKPLIAISDVLQKEHCLEHHIDQLLDRVRWRQKENRGMHFNEWVNKKLPGLLQDFLSSVPKRTAPLVVLHKFRIRVKELRYIVDLVHKAFPTEFYETISPEFKKVQEKLGRINDLVTLDREFQKKITEGTLEENELMRSFLAKNKKSIAQARKDFFHLCTPQFFAHFEAEFKRFL
ncbi:MAG: hypothetical protein A3F67_03915 [Verrucomicrobia bacterium RIFCSPHIGHO2_12_FULL_41_10]|nr:MAG: hypothetical protein A3F67_03915 [Verrucomicrobia bacterium RIFCSPHIGHO2_12_FULL_41_10]HLB32907.1 CHAD domain-containing protein [Chthoniobacterales bacterium]